MNKRGTRGRLARCTSAASLALVLVFTGCSGRSTDAKRDANRSPTVRIRTTPVQRITIQRQIDVSGTLVSPDQARVSSEVAGVVREVLVELGREVRPGQELVRLEPRELLLAAKRAESILRQTEAQLGIDGESVKEPPSDEQIAGVRLAQANRDDARAQLARAMRLASQGLLAQVDLDTAETRGKVTEAAYQAALENVHSLKASLQDRRAAYELAQKKLSDATIRAPVGGQVSERLVQPGEFIRENTPVVTIVQMHPLKLRTAVQERYADKIQPGLPVQFKVESFPGFSFEGRVAYVSPAVDQSTRTFPVEALVDNSNRQLKPGFFAKGIILTHRDENVLAVPEEAVSTLAGVSTVYVVEQNKVRQQIVSLGVHEGKYFELVEGLKGNEILATSNLSQLATGVVVEAVRSGGSEPPLATSGSDKNATSPSHDGQGGRQ